MTYMTRRTMHSMRRRTTMMVIVIVDCSYSLTTCSIRNQETNTYCIYCMHTHTLDYTSYVIHVMYNCTLCVQFIIIIPLHDDYLYICSRTICLHIMPSSEGFAEGFAALVESAPACCCLSCAAAWSSARCSRCPCGDAVHSPSSACITIRDC